jgi:DNA-directed RNA polymerase specialized sigma54-like protein
MFCRALPADGEGEGGEAIAAGEQSEEGIGDEGVLTKPARCFEEIDFGREFQDYLDPGYKTQEIEYKEDAPTFEQFLTVHRHLPIISSGNSHESDRGDVCDAAICVIGNLNADGRLNATNEEMAAMGKLERRVVERARQAVMRLDPVGCGARDVKSVCWSNSKCSVKAIGSRPVDQRTLSDLQQHKLPHLAKQIGIDVETLLEELQFIRTLDPYPGGVIHQKNRS